MMRLAAILLMFFCGCQSVTKQNENSPFYKVPSGAELILHQAITVPPRQLKVYIQDGRLVYAPDRYYPFCKFELRRVQKHPQIVAADRFQILRTRRIKSHFVSIDRGPLVVSLLLNFPKDGKPSPIVYGTRMELRSATQDQVLALTCGHLQDPNMLARHLSINQIRATLGKVFTLQLPFNPHQMSNAEHAQRSSIQNPL